jgi:hypothetical protein
MLGRKFEARSRRFWLRAIADIGAGLLWGAALVAFTVDVDGGVTSVAPLAMVALTASAMGLRNATVRALEVPDLTTTVLTLTITGPAADSRLAGGPGPNLARRISSVAVILAGRIRRVARDPRGVRVAIGDRRGGRDAGHLLVGGGARSGSTAASARRRRPLRGRTCFARDCVSR